MLNKDNPAKGDNMFNVSSCFELVPSPLRSRDYDLSILYIPREPSIVQKERKHSVMCLESTFNTILKE